MLPSLKADARDRQEVAGSVSSAARQVADLCPSPCVNWCQLSCATLTLRDRPFVVTGHTRRKAAGRLMVSDE
jgi:hypothetical protein